MVLQFFFIRFANLSFYTKHMFKFIYVNQLIHMVILVDNVDKFVHNLIIGGFADFCHVENFLESFSLIHHGSTGFVHFAGNAFFSLDSKRIFCYCLTTKTQCGFFSFDFFRHTICPIS